MDAYTARLPSVRIVRTANAVRSRLLGRTWGAGLALLALSRRPGARSTPSPVPLAHRAWRHALPAQRRAPSICGAEATPDMVDADLASRALRLFIEVIAPATAATKAATWRTAKYGLAATARPVAGDCGWRRPSPGGVRWPGPAGLFGAQQEMAQPTGNWPPAPYPAFLGAGT